MRGPQLQIAGAVDIHGHADSGRRFPRKHTLADVYSRTVNAQRPVREVIDQAFPWCAEYSDAMVGLFRSYTARKRALGVIIER